MRPIDADALLNEAEYDSNFRVIIPAEKVKTAPTFTPPNEWVSVEERFPDTEGCYLVTYVFIKDGRASEKSFISTMDYYEQYEGEDNKHFSHEGYQGLRVTHWMPLPAPPDRRPPEGRKDT